MADGSTVRLSKEKREEYMALFNDLDTNGDGSLSREEIAQWLKGMGLKLNDFKIEKIFRVIDGNSDGKISLDEFYVAMEMIKIPPENNQANLRKAFQAMDKNGDGLLSVQELHQACRNTGYTFTQQQVENMVSNIERSEAGGINFDEFMQFFKT